jgi:hypothetical protein
VKRRLYIAAGAAAALVVAFVAGRYSRPARVVETVKVETREVVKVEWRDREVVKRVEGPVREVERIVEKPGAERVITRWIERGPVTTDTQSDLTGTASATTDTASATSRVSEGGRPGWSVGAAATWDPRALSSRPERVAVEVDRRMFGTVWLGLRASAEPDGAEPAVGLGLRMEF